MRKPKTILIPLLPLLLLAVPSVHAQQPHAGYPTYVGRISHQSRHPRPHNKLGLIQLQGFNLTTDFGTAFPITPIPRPTDKPQIHASLGIEYQVDIASHLALSGGIALEPHLNTLSVMQRLRLSYTYQKFRLFLDGAIATDRQSHQIAIGGCYNIVGFRFGYYTQQPIIAFFFATTASIPTYKTYK